MPKSLAVRRRRNKSATRAVFVIQEKDLPKYAPKLPRLFETQIEDGLPVAHEVQWHPMALKLWKDVWSSPMKHAYLHVDQAALFRRVYLEHQYWHGGTRLDVAAEIRQLDRVLGLTPMSRRSLEWITEWDPEEKPKQPKKREQDSVVDARFADDNPDEVLS